MLRQFGAVVMLRVVSCDVDRIVDTFNLVGMDFLVSLSVVRTATFAHKVWNCWLTDADYVAASHNKKHVLSKICQYSTANRWQY